MIADDVCRFERTSCEWLECSRKGWCSGLPTRRPAALRIRSRPRTSTEEGTTGVGGRLPETSVAQRRSELFPGYFRLGWLLEWLEACPPEAAPHGRRHGRVAVRYIPRMEPLLERTYGRQGRP